MRLLVFCLSAVFASPAAATGPVPITRTALSSAVINGLAINSTRYTDFLPVSDKRSITFEIAYTYSAASAVTMSCETSDTQSTTDGAGFDLHILEDSATSGTSNSLPHVWSNAVAGDESWTWTLTNLPHDYVNCWFDGTSADGSDTVIVKWKAATP
jgi:hypothetical protein